MKSLLLIGITALNFTALAPIAEARMAIETSTAKVDGVVAPQAHKSGVIGQIDLGAGIMVVGSLKYVFTPSMTRVSRKSGSSTETLNPLNLRPGSQVEYLTKKEGERERITDIWLIGGKQ